MNLGYKTFSKYFSDNKEKSKLLLSDEDIVNTFNDFLDFETGYYLTEKYIEANSVGINIEAIPHENILLLSLVESIPNNIDLLKPFKYSFNGISFYSNGKESRTKKIKYNEIIRQRLLINLLTINCNINEEISTSQDYINKIKNLVIFINSEEQFNREGLNKYLSYSDWMKYKKNLNATPLKNISNGTNINSYTGINIKSFLADLIDISNNPVQKKIIEKAEFIVIHPTGIYLIDTVGKLDIIPVNNNIISVFEFKNTYNLNTNSSLGGKKINDDTQVYINKIKNNLKDILLKMKNNNLTNNSNNHCGYNRLIGLFYSFYGVQIHETNIIRYPELQDTKFQNTLLKVLEPFKLILKNLYNEDLLIGKTKGRSEVDFKNNKSVALMLKREQLVFLNPTQIKFYLMEGDSINIDDIELLISYPEYKKIFITIFMARLFRRIINLKTKDVNELNDSTFTNSRKQKISNRIYTFQNYYDSFKDALGDRLLDEINNLENRFNFPKNDSLTEHTILINYFMKYGTLYMEEREGNIEKTNIPFKIREFFKNIFFGDFEKLNFDIN